MMVIIVSVVSKNLKMQFELVVEDVQEKISEKVQC